MKIIRKRILFPILSRLYKRANSREQFVTRNGLKIRVLPGVFHPVYFFSTQILVDYLNKQDLTGKSLLELGAGSGMISCFAASKGAVVTATDINPTAVQGVQENAKANDLSVQCIQTDLLEGLDPNQFDWIIINPPYYRKNPGNDAEKAFFCGENMDYFVRLYTDLGQRWNGQKKVLMILSEDCELQAIEAIATTNKIRMQLIQTIPKFGEANYLYQLKNDE